MKNNHSENGLSMIEAMISLVIFALGSLGILAIYMNTFSLASDNQNLTSGYQIAQSAMATLRANGAIANQFNGATISDTQASSATLSPVSAAMSEYGMPPNAIVHLSVVPLNGADTCPCSATVSVSWGITHTKTYSTQSIVGY